MRHKQHDSNDNKHDAFVQYASANRSRRPRPCRSQRPQWLYSSYQLLGPNRARPLRIHRVGGDNNAAIRRQKRKN